MKKFLVSLLLIFVVVGCSCKNDQIEETKDPTKLEDGEMIKLTGRVAFYNVGNPYFSLDDGGQLYTVFTDEAVVLKSYVEVSGNWNKANNGLEVDQYRVLTDDEVSFYLQKRYLILEIEILEFPKMVNDTCETPKLKLKITNKGNQAISHQDLYDEKSLYAFYYLIDDVHTRMNADVSNYTETNNEEIGLLSNQGFIYFESIKPGKSQVVEYWGGGKITKTAGGTAGEHNIFMNKQAKNYQVSIAWGLKNNFDPLFLFKTEEVNIELKSDHCDMGL